MEKSWKLVCGLAVLLFLTACSQYEDGPNMSLYSKGKRVQGTWYFSNVFHGSIDSTETYQRGAVEFLLGEGSGKDWGLFTWNKGVANSIFDPNRMQFGAWKFIADKDSFQMIMVQAHVEDYDTIEWKINRLAYDEWWMERHVNDTTLVVWRLWKWVM